jgi:hypothetical protein
MKRSTSAVELDQDTAITAPNANILTPSSATTAATASPCPRAEVFTNHDLLHEILTYCDKLSLLQADCVSKGWRAFSAGEKGDDLWFHFIFLRWRELKRDNVARLTGMAKSFYLQAAPLDDLCKRKVNTKEEEYYRLLEMFAGAYLDIKIHDEQTGRDLCAFLVRVTDKYEMELFATVASLSLLKPLPLLTSPLDRAFHGTRMSH